MTRDARRPHRGWWILAVGTLGVLGALGLGRFGYSTVLRSMQRELPLTDVQTGGLAASNLAGYVVLSAFGGALASRFGARRVAGLGLLVAGAGMLLTGTAAGFLDAAAWRFVTGLGSGAANVSIMGMLAAWFVARRRGLAAGVAVSGSSLALIALGLLVPRVLAGVGVGAWRTCWAGFGVATVIIGALALACLRNRPSDVGLEPIGGYSLPAEAARPAERLAWSRVYASGPVWHLGLVYVAFGFSYIIYLTWFLKRLVDEGGWTEAGAGSLFMVLGWCSLLCGVVWGGVSDGIGRKWALAIVYLLQAASFALFAAWPGSPGFEISAVLFGLTAWSIPAIMAAACGDALGPRLAPAALGFITVFFGAGQAAGPLVAGVLAEASGSFAPAYGLAAVVAAAGAVGSATLPGGGRAGTAAARA